MKKDRIKVGWVRKCSLETQEGDSEICDIRNAKTNEKMYIVPEILIQQHVLWPNGNASQKPLEGQG